MMQPNNRYVHAFKRYDRKVLMYITLFVALINFSQIFVPVQEVNKVEVYYNNNLVFTTNLDIEDKFELEQSNYEHINKKIVIEVSFGKVRIVESNSTKRDCSSMGWIQSAYEQLTCIENKIVVKLKHDDSFKLPGDVIHCDIGDKNKCPI